MSASLKRKKGALEEENVLGRAEETAFQSAFFLLDNEKESTVLDAQEPLLKRQRVDENMTSNRVPEVMGVCPDVVGTSSLGDKHQDESAPPAFQRTFHILAPHNSDFNDSQSEAESKSVVKKESVNTSLTPLQQVKERIHTLVSTHGPALGLGRLKSLYQASYDGDTLDYKALGFKKLKRLVESVQSVEMELVGTDWALFLSTDDVRPRPDLSRTTTKKEAKNERKARLRQIQKRICVVVAKHSPLAVNLLVPYYQDEFSGDALDYKALGFDSLNKLIKSLSSVKTKTIQGKPMIIMSKPMGCYSKDRKEQVLSRVHAVVAKHHPLCLGHLTHRYEVAFPGDSLDFKAMGFTKLKLLIQSMHSIKMKNLGNAETFLSCRLANTSCVPESLKVTTETQLLAPKATHVVNNDSVKETSTIASESQEMVDGVFSGPKSIDEAQVAVRLQLLVARHAPLDLSVVPSLYRESFGERLDVKTFGYGKLGNFVSSIPFIHVTKSGNCRILSQTSETATVKDAVVAADPRDVVDANKVSGLAVSHDADDLVGDSIGTLDSDASAKENDAASQNVVATDDQVEANHVAMFLHVDNKKVSSKSALDVESLFVLDYTGDQDVNVEAGRQDSMDATATDGAVVPHSDDSNDFTRNAQAVQ